ncbi:glycosyltransferase [Candidatus Neomarinimicrobiota bacterium]
MKNCSVIIRSFNEEKHIGRLLVGIMEQTVKDVEIILVDSGSTDATVSIASQFPAKIVNIEPADFSFGRALNMGCAVATKEFLVMASSHVFPVHHDWLEQLLSPFDDPKIGLVYGRQLGGATTKFTEHQIFAQWFPDTSVKRQAHPFCNNANAAIRRNLWEKMPYDEELTGLEDLDWANRLLKEGYFLSYKAGAAIIHLHDETPSNIYNRYRREAIAHKLTFPEQRFSFWEFVKLTSSNIISDYYHAAHDGCLLKNIVDIPMFRLLQFWGTYRGFKMDGSINRKLKQTFYYPRNFTRLEQGELTDSSKRIEYDRKITDYINE